MRKSVRIFSRFRFDIVSGFPFELVGTGCLLVTGEDQPVHGLFSMLRRGSPIQAELYDFCSSFLFRLVDHCELPVRD